MGWLATLQNIIERNFGINEVFDLEQINEHEQFFMQQYPRNRHVRETIRKTLQRLRDSGDIEFLAGGQYRRLR